MLGLLLLLLILLLLAALFNLGGATGLLLEESPASRSSARVSVLFLMDGITWHETRSVWEVALSSSYLDCCHWVWVALTRQILERTIIAMQLPPSLGWTAGPALGPALQVAQLYLLVLRRPLLSLLLLYESSLLVQLVLPHVGGRNVLHPDNGNMMRTMRNVSSTVVTPNSKHATLTQEK